MSIKAFCILCALPVGALLSISPAAATTYNYTGQNFITAPSPYTMSDNVTGFVTFSSPLADNTTYSGYPPTPTPPTLLSFSFFDGIQTITNLNATGVTTFLLETGPSGNIIMWNLYVDGANGGYININNNGGGLNQFDKAACVDTPSTACSDADVTASNEVDGTNNAGSWSPPTSATPLPTALPLFATGLGAMGLFGWRRKRKAQAVG